jgi:AcrR family transcriptional regulator
MEKDHIILRARDLFMRYGIKSVTMDDVSRELGISKKTLYTIVDSKRDLVAKALDAEFSSECAVMKEIKENAPNALEGMIQVSHFLVELFRKMKPSLIYEMNKYHKKLWMSWEKSHKNQIYTHIKENIILGQKEGCYLEDVNPDIIAKLYVTKAYAILDERIFPRSEYSSDLLIQEHIHYHLRGIISEKCRPRLESIRPKSKKIIA